MDKREENCILKTDLNWDFDEYKTQNRVYEFENFLVVIAKQHNRYENTSISRLSRYVEDDVVKCRFIDKKTGEIIVSEDILNGDEDIVKTNNNFVVTPKCAVTLGGKVMCTPGPEICAPEQYAPKLFEPELFGKNLLKAQDFVYNKNGFVSKRCPSLFDKNGNRVFSFSDLKVEEENLKEMDIADLKDGRAIVTLTTKNEGIKIGLLDENGKLINGFPYKVFEALRFNDVVDEYFALMENGEQVLLDKNLNVIDKFNFQDEFSLNMVAKKIYYFKHKKGEEYYQSFYNGKDWFNVEEKMKELFSWFGENSLGRFISSYFRYCEKSEIGELFVSSYTLENGWKCNPCTATILLDKDFNVLLKSQRDEKLTLEVDEPKTLLVHSELTNQDTLFKKKIMGDKLSLELVHTAREIFHIANTENWYGVTSDKSDYLINADTGEVMFKDDEYTFRILPGMSNLYYDRDGKYLQMEAMPNSKQSGNIWMISLEELRRRESYDANVVAADLKTQDIEPSKNNLEEDNGQYVIPGFIDNEDVSNKKPDVKMMQKTLNNK